jgi:membrane protease YdiL (CAAX protease family)
VTTEEFGWLAATLWVLASIIVILRLRVFQARPLAEAPARHGVMTLATVGGVILVYIGAFVFAAMAERQAGWIRLPEGQTAPAATAAAAAAGLGRPPAPAKTGDDLPTAVAMQAADAFAKLLAISLAILLVRRLLVGGLRGWGLSFRRLLPGIAAGAAGYLVVIPLVYISSVGVNDLLQRFLHRSMTPHATLAALASHPSLLLKIALIFFAGVSAPILEELFFRGLLQTALIEQGWGFVPREVPDISYRPSPAHRWGAILITSLVFAAVHASLEQGLVLFVLSLGLGYLYERTGNLWAPITLHFLFNGINLAIALLGS